jgi:ubiquinone/menaquinone biosynthesis C-methylase UbiE
MGDFDKKEMGGKPYDKVMALVGSYYHPLLEKLSSKVREHLRNTPQPLIIDLGCGTGVSTGYLLSAVPSAQIIAVDSSDKMLEAIPEELMFSFRIQWRVEDMSATLSKFSDESLDVAVNAYAIHNMAPTERHKVFALIARKLKKGGLFISADKIAVSDEAEHKAMLEERVVAYKGLADKGLPQQSKEWLSHLQNDEAIRMKESEIFEQFASLGLEAPQFGPRLELYELCSTVKK